jgi:hypothetical protein
VKLLLIEDEIVIPQVSTLPGNATPLNIFQEKDEIKNFSTYCFV